MKPVYLDNVSIHITADVNATVDIKGKLKKPLKLTKTEARILRTIFERPGTVCTPRMIAAGIYPGKNAHNLPEQKIIDVYICGIRKKLRTSELPDPITNVWGRGYRFGEAKPAIVSDLIPPELRKPARWYTQRKEEVLSRITDLASQRAMFDFFTDLSEEELHEWWCLYQENGGMSLRSTRAWLNV